MNVSSIQTSLHGIVILQLLLQLSNVIALYIYIYIYYSIKIFKIIIIYIIDNFMNFNLQVVDMCHYLG
jgi:hypothetical protein